MHQYKCDICGASLDPAEKCDCSIENQHTPNEAKEEKEEKTCKKTA